MYHVPADGTAARMLRSRVYIVKYTESQKRVLALRCVQTAASCGIISPPAARGHGEGSYISGFSSVDRGSEIKSETLEMSGRFCCHFLAFGLHSAGWLDESAKQQFQTLRH